MTPPVDDRQPRKQEDLDTLQVTIQRAIERRRPRLAGREPMETARAGWSGEEA